MSVATKPNNIHPSAVISPRARIGSGCFIGPFSTIGDEVELHDGVRLESHVVIGRQYRNWARHAVFPFVSIGLPAQDLKYKGEPSQTSSVSANTSESL
jgi:UDP-N-acetylglucosamine acyltransferase